MSRATYCLAVMSKAPLPGRVKTRLIATLGAKRAAGIYRQLLMQSCKNIASLKQMDIRLYCTPNIRHISFLNIAHRYGYARHQQSAGDLGQRMSAVFSSLLRHYRGVILIGADSPVVDSRVVEQCRSHLEQGADLVLGTTEDGGYALIGLRRPQPTLFRAVPWRSARVADITRRRAAHLGLKSEEISKLWDVDTAADVRRWRRHNRRVVSN